jgi:hypothetical protein
LYANPEPSTSSRTAESTTTPAGSSKTPSSAGLTQPVNTSQVGEEKLIRRSGRSASHLSHLPIIIVKQEKEFVAQSQPQSLRRKQKAPSISPLQVSRQIDYIPPSTQTIGNPRPSPQLSGTTVVLSPSPAAKVETAPPTKRPHRPKRPKPERIPSSQSDEEEMTIPRHAPSGMPTEGWHATDSEPPSSDEPWENQEARLSSPLTSCSSSYLEESFVEGETVHSQEGLHAFSDAANTSSQIPSQTNNLHRYPPTSSNLGVTEERVTNLAAINEDGDVDMFADPDLSGLQPSSRAPSPNPMVALDVESKTAAVIARIRFQAARRVEIKEQEESDNPTNLQVGAAAESSGSEDEDLFAMARAKRIKKESSL